MTDSFEKPTTKRRRGSGILFLGLVILVITYIFFQDSFTLSDYVKHRVVEKIQSYGIKGATIQSINVGLTGTELNDVIIPSEDGKSVDLKAKRVAVKYTPFDLIARKIKGADIEGMDLFITISDDGDVSLGQLEKLLKKKGDKPTKLPHISLKDSHIHALTPMGKFEVPISMSAAPQSKAHSLSIDGQWSLKSVPDMKAQTSIETEGERIRLQTEFSDLTITYDDITTNIPKATLKILINEDEHDYQIDLKALVRELKHKEYGSLATPLSVHTIGFGNFNKFEVESTWTQQGQLKPLIEIKGPLNPVKKSGDLKITLLEAPLSQSWNAMPFLRSLDRTLKTFDIKVSANGKLVFRGDWEKPSGPIKVSLKEGAMETAEFSMEGLTTNMTILKLAPFKTAAKQKIALTHFSVMPMIIEDIKLTYQFNSPDKLYLSDLTGKALGGSFRSKQIKNLGKKIEDGYDLSLDLTDVKLQELVALPNINGLYGKSLMSGSLKAQLRETGFEVEDVSLRSTSEMGIIRYDPENPGALDRPATGKPGGHNIDPNKVPQGADLAFAVLKDLHFTLLAFSIDSDPKVKNSMKAAIKITGFNPNVLNGYPFEFNISTTGQLQDLIENTLRDLTQPEDAGELREKLKDYLKTQSGENTDG